MPEPDRPTISLLFSGGVFRGVFQVGVVAALNEAGVQPDLVAGSSVGAITAAMVSSVFTKENNERKNHIAKLAAAFISIDHLVLTDRFADFIRRFTLRAGDCNFCLRDLDQVFRRYEQGDLTAFTKRARRAVAGLERLLYVNPFALIEFSRAVHSSQWAEVLQRLKEQVQVTIDAFGVGDQLLGAEPLDLLITHLVLEDKPMEVQFNAFLEKGIQFLATSTNISKGELRIFNSSPQSNLERAILRQGLLAGSAFPAVFRPRREWEICPGTENTDLFVDGGIMDNLPLDAVVEFLQRKGVPGSPKAGSHLIFTASLEPEIERISPQEVAELSAFWPQLQKRAKRLRYNRKFTLFSDAQKHFRILRENANQANIGQRNDGWPLDIEAVMVIPKWLCGTFAFHPMLGFKRRKQAASIAHGCASTFARLYALIEEKVQQNRNDWMAWGLGPLTTGDTAIRPSTVKEGLRPDLAPRAIAGQTTLSEEKHLDGKCWFRQGALCPFSDAALRQTSALSDTSRKELNQIYELCGKRETHEIGSSWDTFQSRMQDL